MTSPMPAYRRLEPPSTRMHKISLAPVLSATLSRHSCGSPSTPASAVPAIVAAWRVVAPGRVPRWLLGLLQDLGDPPALGCRHRPGLHQPDPVALATGVLGVVGLVLLGAPDDLGVLGVLHPVLDLDHDGLVHLVADDVALADLAVAAGGPALVASRHCPGVTHCLPPPRPPRRPWSRCRARAPASPCRCARSPCARRAAARGSPAGRWRPGTGG